MEEFYKGFNIHISQYTNGNFGAVWQERISPLATTGGVNQLMDFNAPEYTSMASVMDRIKAHLDGITPLPSKS